MRMSYKKIINLSDDILEDMWNSFDWNDVRSK